MASTREEIARHITLCKQGGADGAGEHLQAVQALLLQSTFEPPERLALLRSSLHDILELQGSPVVATRKRLAEFLEAAALAAPPLLPFILPCLKALLSDAQPGVVKRTLQAGRLLMPEVVRQLLQDFKPGSEMASQPARLWEAAQAFKESAVATALDHTNTGVRLYGVKFLEALILLYTPQADSSGTVTNGTALFTVHAGLVPPGHPFLDPTQLAVEATGYLASLLRTLRGPSAAGLPTPVMLVLISSLTTIAAQRMSFFGRILPALLALSQAPADQGSSEIGGDVKPRIQPPSVLHALKVAYVTLVKLQDASVAPWRPRLISGLRSIGANDAANAEERHIERQTQQQQGAASTRKRGAEKVRPAENVRSNGSGVDGAEGGGKRVKIEGVEGERPKSVPAVEPGPAAGAGKATGVTSLDAMLGLVCQLAARTEPEAQAQLRQLVEQMPIGILVDLVMASMKNDPRPQPEIKREGSQSEVHDAKPLKQEISFGSPPGFPPQVKRENLPPPPPLPNFAREPHPRPLSQAPAPPTTPRGPASGVLARTSTPPIASGGQVTGVGDGRWAVVRLSDVQRVEQARGAINRVVKAGQLVKGTRAGRLRAALVGRMLAQAEEAADEGRLEEVVGQLFSDAAKNDALEVALQWLYCVYALYQLQQMDDADVMPEDNVYVIEPEDAHVIQGGDAGVIKRESDDVIRQDGADVMETDSAALTKRDDADVMKMDDADGSRQDGADVMDESVAGGGALAVLEDEPEAPETYRSLLLSLARAAASRLPPSDRSFQRLLCDAPALPPSILALLRSMLQPPEPEDEADAAALADDAAASAAARYLERVTQSLSALWALILQRPLLRGRCLDMALRCTYEQSNEEVRNKAIRLVANKLYPLPYCRVAIQAVAREQLEEATQEESVTEGGTVTATSAPEEEDPEEGRARLERTESGRETGTSAEAAKQKMSLFFGLCYKSPELLPLLVARYGTAGKGAKQAILRQVPLLLKSVGPSSPPVLAILEDPPAGVEPLLLQILNVLTESAPPSEELTQRVKTLYETKLKDARLLIPILSFMKKDEARSVFPALLTLPLPQFKLALNRLLQGSAATGPALTPTEVLVALHEVDPKKDGVPLKKVTDACTACMAQRAIFNPQVLAATLNQLVERSPLPLLFMRTVLQSVGASPSLRPFVVELLGRLVKREIWAMPQLWVGFLKAAHHTVPESLPVLLQLPARQVAEVVAKNPDLKPLLAAHVTHSSAKAALPKSILAVLGLESEEGP